MQIETIKARDIIAAIILVGGFILMAFGIDHVVGGIVIAVVVYYFRKRGEDIKIISNGPTNSAKHSS